MAYDEGLAQRVREIVHGRPAITERKMFGGLAFMADGHVFVGVLGERLMVRLPLEAYAQALLLPHVRE
ncbi:TfoX/Sxy family protein, partial [Zoogloea sp.]